MGLMGFWEVVGHKPCVIEDFEPRTTSTFAVKASADKFASIHGGTVKHREADAVILPKCELCDGSTKIYREGFCFKCWAEMHD